MAPHPRKSRRCGTYAWAVQRIAVIGCGGAGKTMLARELGALLSLPVLHIDGHYWRDVDGQQVESTPDQWTQTHRELVAGERWIIDGMKLGALPERLAAADRVVYLDFSTAACLDGVLRRRIRYRGQLLPELGVYDRISLEFLRWILSFRRRQRPRILELLSAYDGRLVVLRNRHEAGRFLRSVGPAQKRVTAPMPSTAISSAAGAGSTTSAACL